MTLDLDSAFKKVKARPYPNIVKTMYNYVKIVKH